MEINSSFWKNKKVFITGHSGFKGSWLTLWLSILESNIFGYSLSPNTNPSLSNILDINNKIQSFEGDIRNFNSLKNSLDNFQPEIVIHMAAQPLVRDSYKNSLYTYETNVMGTINLFEILKGITSVRAILVITSDKSYKNIEKKYSYSENDALGGFDPYSCSKACADLIASSYYNSFFLNKEVGVAIARAGNIIGGGDWSRDRLFPDAIRAFSNNKKLLIRNPNAIRPWQYILDPLSGYLKLIEKLYENFSDFSEAWNFGPTKDEELPVSYVCDKIKLHWGNDSEWQLDINEKQPHEANLLMLNSKKAKTSLNWEGRYGIDEAISKTTDWYLKYYNSSEDMLKTTTSDLLDYT